MAECQVCKTSGSNMKRGKKCNQIWCANCSSKGKGHYPKTTTIVVPSFWTVSVW